MNARSIAIAMMMMVGALVAISPASAVPGDGSGRVPLRFTNEIGNVEYLAKSLTSSRPRSLGGLPEVKGDLFYGQIDRRSGSYDRIVFACEYVRGEPVAAWCDVNGNDDLTDDPTLPFYAYPDHPKARAALVDLSWIATAGQDSLPVAWKIRLVFEPQRAGHPPQCRYQRVHVMAGDVTLDGQKHRGFLYDGNADGVYSKDFGDGLFLDLDGDGAVTVDRMSTEFMPFGVSAQMGPIVLETEHVSPRGDEVVLKQLFRRPPIVRPQPGEFVPDFNVRAIDGQSMSPSALRGSVVAVYFWAAWCGVCSELSGELLQLYERFHSSGFEILSVSMDEDLNVLRSFRESHHEPWPVSYHGRKFWENPLARLYGARATGAVYLVRRDGRLDGLYYDFREIGSKLEKLVASTEP